MPKIFKGYRSVLLQLPPMAFVLLAMLGIIVPDATQLTFTTSYSAIVAVIMRTVSDTAIGQKE